MNNIHEQIDALVKAITENTAALKAFNVPSTTPPAAPTTDEAPVKRGPGRPKKTDTVAATPAPASESVSELTIDSLLSKAEVLLDNKRSDLIREVCTRMGVGRVTDIPVAKYPEALELLETCVQQVKLAPAAPETPKEETPKMIPPAPAPKEEVTLDKIIEVAKKIRDNGNAKFLLDLNKELGIERISLAPQKLWPTIWDRISKAA